MSNKKCVREKYLYLSAMLRAREAKMLTREKAERMIDTASFDEAAKMLADCGYEDYSGMNAKQVDNALAERRAEIFAELARMSPNPETVEVFRMKYDYHNAKTLIKAEAAALEREDLLSSSGRVPVQTLIKSFTEEKFTGVPPVLADAIVQAKSVLARTANPQLADFALDKAYFTELLKAARELDSDFLTGYARILIDSANLRSAVRTMRMGKDLDFLKLALVPGGGIDAGRIAASSSSGETLAALFTNTGLASAAALGAEAVNGGKKYKKNEPEKVRFIFIWCDQRDLNPHVCDNRS